MQPAAPITPARLDFTADSTPCAPDFDDVYHPAAGPLTQAQHVFLGGNGLPGRWAGRQRFVILETGFGLGNNFLATWAAWRMDPARCERLVFISLEKHPLRLADLALVHQTHQFQQDSPMAALAQQLIAQWPLLTPDLHTLDFEAGRVQLMLVFGDAHQTLAGVQASVDAFYLDGFTPARNAAMWSPDVLRRIGRLAAPGATAATWSSARTVRDGLASNGFEVQRVPGCHGKWHMTVARFAPRFVPPAPAAFRPPVAAPQAAIVIGAGLAGCAAAWALARQGWHSTVLDRQAAPAQETSGNAGGLMHGIFNAPDSLHARWFRAGALLTARLAGPALQTGQLSGQLTGLLRLETRLDAERARAQLASVGLPDNYLRWLEPAEAAAMTGLPLAAGGWWYGQAGWLAPGGWAGWLLGQAQAAGLARFQGGAAVARLERAGSAPDAPWQALDADGRLLASAPVVVLANALDAARLLPAPLARPTLGAVRGQTSVLGADLADRAGLRRPRVPLSGQGYALTLPDGRVLTGATSQPGDLAAGIRPADHASNLQRAAALGLFEPDALASLDPTTLGGRAGWRASTPDRLPLIGPPIDPAALAAARAGRARTDALRLRPRCHDAHHGLYLLTGLGSRGITSAALAGQVLAAWVTGAPFPVDAALRDAVDAAR
jgi:tRNA 5-methylaminomethyl-2-thiouridine biosynthesis bifunctional protein